MLPTKVIFEATYSVGGLLNGEHIISILSQRPEVVILARWFSSSFWASLRLLSIYKAK